MPTDIDIARQATPLHIHEIGEKIHIDKDDLLTYGYDKAKISARFIQQISNNPHGKLILVTAINPTPAGEGKTTTTVGLGDALNRIHKQTIICLREPSLGPCFGVKGGAAGGGYSQVIPMEDINLHFTGDFHAISSAHNLLAAMIDNHIHWGNELGIDARRISWRRVVDMNDRALRNITSGLGGPGNGFPRQDGFDITVASEVMAILCLSENLHELEQRLEKIVIGYRRDMSPITAKDIKASGAMAVLLKQAMQPNVVQTLENNPAFVHGGPFANIAHGCNTLIATKTALKLAEYVVTEAGFGADLGAEKFLNIKCRKSGLAPSAVVIVATIRALKMNGGITKDNLGEENVAAVMTGCNNLDRHIENMQKFGLRSVVAINHFHNDTQAEIEAVQRHCAKNNVVAIVCKHWEQGSAGAEELARAVVAMTEQNTSVLQLLYDDDQSLFSKIETVAKQLYRADEVLADSKIRNQLHIWENAGYGTLPICIAKTQYSFTTDPNKRGAPTHHSVPIREVRLAAGAGFIVVICGEIMTMPGLPKQPAAEQICLNTDGLTVGLF